MGLLGLSGLSGLSGKASLYYGKVLSALTPSEANQERIKKGAGIALFATTVLAATVAVTALCVNFNLALGGHCFSHLLKDPKVLSSLLSGASLLALTLIGIKSRPIAAVQEKPGGDTAPPPKTWTSFFSLRLFG